jgi:hypothetical protein
MNEITDRMEEAVEKALEWATYEEVCELANHEPQDTLERYAQSVAFGLMIQMEEAAEN